jgi:hypothetical protein
MATSNAWARAPARHARAAERARRTFSRGSEARSTDRQAKATLVTRRL